MNAKKMILAFETRTRKDRKYSNVFIVTVHRSRKGVATHCSIHFKCKGLSFGELKLIPNFAFLGKFYEKISCYL
jgi:hypothetical protein